MGDTHYEGDAKAPIELPIVALLCGSWPEATLRDWGCVESGAIPRICWTTTIRAGCTRNNPARYTFGMFRFIALALLGLSAAVAQDGWISLFNGKDFTGWKVSEHETSFSIKDGAIVAHGERAHCFYVGDAAKHNFKNFELKVDVKAGPGSNGGIFFHTEYQDSGWPAKGFEVQVNNTYNRDPVKTGSLYHVKDVREALPKDDEWFTEHIVVRGNTVTISVNGKETASWTQPADWNGTSEFVGRRIGSGTIALQGHDPGSTVAYKNIQIKLLP